MYSQILCTIFFLLFLNMATASHFVTFWLIPSESKTITIPTTGNGYNYNISWGDGTVTYNHEGNASHTYQSGGNAEIRIWGDFPRIYFNNSENKDDIITVRQWGDIQWNSFNSAFAGCSKLAGHAIDNPDLSQVTDMRFAFKNAPKWNQQMNGWDVSGVELVDEMFQGALEFNSPLNSWNTSNFTSMKSMFQNAQSFNQDLNDWDISKINNLDYVFFNARNFNGVIKDWDISNIQSMKGTFHDAKKFNQPLGSWNVGRVKDMYALFSDANSFNQNISNWDVDSVLIMNSMFYQADAFNQDISNWNTTQCTDMSFMFQATDKFNQDLSNWNVINVIYMHKMFSGAKRMNQNLGNWSINPQCDLTEMLDNSGMCTENYDLTLLGWSALDISDINLGSVQLDYCQSDSLRNDLVNNKNWNIIGDDYECSDDNIWLNLTGTGSWFDHTINWSKGHFPKECENVVINNGLSLTIESSDTIYVHSYIIDSTSTLINNGTIFIQSN